MSELRITPEKVRAAAEKCSTAAATLKVLFPEAFEEKDEPYEFTDDCKLSSWESQSIPPIYIGDEHAPPGLKYKCLIVSGSYEMRTQEHQGLTILTFHRKP